MNEKTKIFQSILVSFVVVNANLVETIIDDEFLWNGDDQMYQPNKFTDMFEHTGNQRCAECGEKWSGF